MLHHRLPSPLRTLASFALLLCLPPGEVQFVTPEGAPLLPVPGAGGAPELGLLYQGAAVRIEEDRGDYVRVSFQAWIAREHLSPQRPATLGRQEAPAPVAREEPQGSPAPLRDLNRAHYVQVDLVEDDVGSLVALLTLATRDGIPVELPENPLPVVLNVFNERRVGNSMVRDELLFTGEGELGAAGRRFAVPLGEIAPEEGTRIVTVSVKVRLGKERTLLGSRRGIVVPAQ